MGSGRVSGQVVHRKQIKEKSNQAQCKRFTVKILDYSVCTIYRTQSDLICDISHLIVRHVSLKTCWQYRGVDLSFRYLSTVLLSNRYLFHKIAHSTLCHEVGLWENQHFYYHSTFCCGEGSSFSVYENVQQKPSVFLQ